MICNDAQAEFEAAPGRLAPRIQRLRVGSLFSCLRCPYFATMKLCISVILALLLAAGPKASARRLGACQMPRGTRDPGRQFSRRLRFIWG